MIIYPASRAVEIFVLDTYSWKPPSIDHGNYSSQPASTHRPSNMVRIDHHEHLSTEERRLKEDRDRTKYWKKWGPYVAERQWATGRTLRVSQ